MELGYKTQTSVHANILSTLIKSAVVIFQYHFCDLCVTNFGIKAGLNSRSNLSETALFSFRHGSVGASVGVRSLASVPSLPSAVADFVKGAVEECKPSNVHVVTGTPEETANILAGLEKEGMVKRLPKYENWYGYIHYSCNRFSFAPSPLFAASQLSFLIPALLVVGWHAQTRRMWPG